MPGHGTGHLDLTTFPAQLDRLRDVGAVTPAIDVVAVHLGHHKPPAAELARARSPGTVRGWWPTATA